MPEFNDWFPTSLHGTDALNVKDFGAVGDGVGRTLNGIYATLPEAQADFPSATSLTDYVDWCAFTECFKHAFQHETSPGVWVPNATLSELNRPVSIPSGRYVIGKPLHWNNIQGGWIYGGNALTNIHNEMGTPGQSGCVITNGFCYNRIENITFGTVGGEAAAHAFDLNWGTGALVAANACTFNNCHFSAPSGIGISLADPASFAGSGNMCSEVHFYHCTMNNCAVGIYIAGANALNYSFIGCGGISNTTCWLQVSAGGMVTVINGSLAGNTLDIDVGADKATIISTRTESKFFLKVGGWGASVISCSQTHQGYDVVFCQAQSPVHLIGCYTQMGRLHGSGPATISNCHFNVDATYPISSVANNGSGLIRVVHPDSSPGYSDLWMDGDEVLIEFVTGSGAASINGVWNVTKVNATTVDLIGSTHGGLTYTLTGGALIRPGPRYHLTDNLVSLGYPAGTMATEIAHRTTTLTRTKDVTLQWLDSGAVVNNYKATGAVVITLPELWYGRQGTRFEFVVVEAQMLTIQINPAGFAPTHTQKSRIIEAGSPPTEGLQIASNMVGASIELHTIDCVPQDEAPVVGGNAQAGYRWLVIRKTGTWTLSGDPTP